MGRSPYGDKCHLAVSASYQKIGNFGTDHQVIAGDAGDRIAVVTAAKQEYRQARLLEISTRTSTR
ncbi:hypothetical protein FEM41_14070 [Jejubacter calystegiae]|uniref:Uncharacterized protein n=1 Tax=Jejubacter calystegiae TaxID=2579935 RepID=A0A4P8YIX4_9ENTR|nr:hypothetical protein [Jejubacter calystegiae]QCT20689.1 hypothetical protein FEM41_14070 [Jejubacter calystegiae]